MLLPGRGMILEDGTDADVKAEGAMHLVGQLQIGGIGVPKGVGTWEEGDGMALKWLEVLLRQVGGIAVGQPQQGRVK